MCSKGASNNNVRTVDVAVNICLKGPKYAGTGGGEGIKLEKFCGRNFADGIWMIDVPQT